MTLVQAYNNLNNYCPNTHFLSQNITGNDGVAFHTIQEQDESKSIGAESLTMGSFATQGNNQGSNRSLPSWTLLAVLWQMCHVWITYRTSSGAVLMMNKLNRKCQKSTTWHASGSLMTGIPCLEHS